VATGIDEVAATIFQARQVKPLRGFVRGYCASAAYYLLSACHRIDATPSSTVGSIGTIYTHFEYAEALKEMGVGVTVIKHGERKADGNAYEKLSPAARASLQQWVSAFGVQFEQAVARNRNISLDEVRARYGQGQAFLAPESKERGLIDGVSTWEQVLGSLKTPAAPLPQPGQTLSIAAGTLMPGWSPAEEAAYELAAINDHLSAQLSASAIPAGACAGSSLLPAASSAAGEQDESTMKITPRVRAALFARGLIAAYDAAEEACLAALNAFAAGRGQAVPTEEAAQLALLNGAAASAPAAAASPAGATPTPAAAAGSSPPPASGAAANVQQAHEREMTEARQQILADERSRVAEIQASGEMLGLSQELIQQAIRSGQPFAEVTAGWVRHLAEREKPISQAAQVTVGQEGIERYVADATLAVLLHLEREVPAAQITPQVRQLSRAPLLVHAEQCLRAAGVRFDPYDREATAQAALAMDGYEHQVIRADIPYNRPGSFPNLLSSLANKVLDEGVQLADTTYESYTGVWRNDLPDFKPAPVVAKGQVGELDEVLDAEEFKEQGLSEECLSYMQLARFGNAIKLTPVLLANDDLGAFVEDLLGLSNGWELTQNRGCLRLVTGNVYLLDGFQLYDDTNHANHIASGGAAPGDSEWDKMQIKMSKQTVIGGKGYARTRLSIALVPPALERGALQAFLPMRDMAEMKQPATDSNLNVYRGRVTVVTEPELAATSEVEWYGFADPRRFGGATIIRAYFRGWGRAGKRERWYDPSTKCYYVSLEGRGGFAAKQYRTTVKNKGAA
jgi:ClpP class serine protease